MAAVGGAGAGVTAIDPKTILQFIESAGAGNLEDVKNILGENPGILNKQDKSGITALYYAAYFGRTDVVKFLLAQPDIKFELGPSLNMYTSLYAAINGYNKFDPRDKLERHINTIKSLVANSKVEKYLNDDALGMYTYDRLALTKGNSHFLAEYKFATDKIKRHEYQMKELTNAVTRLYQSGASRRTRHRRRHQRSKSQKRKSH